MSNTRTRGSAMRSAPPVSKRPLPRSGQRSGAAMLLLVIAGVAVVALVIAIVATRGSSGGVGSDIEQTRPVTVSGAALAALPDSGTDPAHGPRRAGTHRRGFRRQRSCHRQ